LSGPFVGTHASVEPGRKATSYTLRMPVATIVALSFGWSRSEGSMRSSEPDQG
jgi:hypothetical protein